MGRSPQSSETNEVKKGPWTPEEDQKLREYIEKNGQGSWQLLPKKAGLNRCGKSCRLRWTNYLRPDIRRGNFSPQEEQTIIDLHALVGNKWSMIAARLPGRTDNEVKNHWNTHLRKKLLKSGIDPKTHQPITDLSLLNINNMIINPIENLAKIQLFCNIMQVLNTSPTPPSIFSQFDGLMLNNDPLQLHSSLSSSSLVNPNLESSLNNLMMSGSYRHVLDTFETMPELRYSMNGTTVSSEIINTKTESSSLPGLVPATPEISYAAQMIHTSTNDNSMENTNMYDEALLMLRPKNSSSCDNWPEMNPNEEASSSFLKDILNDSFFPFYM